MRVICGGILNSDIVFVSESSELRRLKDLGIASDDFERVAKVGQYVIFHELHNHYISSIPRWNGLNPLVEVISG